MHKAFYHFRNVIEDKKLKILSKQFMKRVYKENISKPKPFICALVDIELDSLCKL